MNFSLGKIHNHGFFFGKKNQGLALFNYGNECEPPSCFGIYETRCVVDQPGGVVTATGYSYGAIFPTIDEQLTLEVSDPDICF